MKARSNQKFREKKWELLEVWKTLMAVDCSLGIERGIPKPPPEREVFESKVKKLLPTLERFAYKITFPDRDFAEDVLQESIVRAYRLYREGKLDLDMGLQTWFVRVLRNEFLCVRRKDRRMTALSETAMDAEVCPSEGAEKMVERGALIEKLLQIVESLSEDQRAVLECIDMCGMTYVETSNHLGVHLGTVRSRLGRARLKVASRLQDYRDV